MTMAGKSASVLTGNVNFIAILCSMKICDILYLQVFTYLNYLWTFTQDFDCFSIARFILDPIISGLCMFFLCFIVLEYSIQSLK